MPALKFLGSLADKYAEMWFDVSTPVELLAAYEANFPGFSADALKARCVFVVNDKEMLTSERANLPMSSKEWVTVVPDASGAEPGGMMIVYQIVAALVISWVASILFPVPEIKDEKDSEKSKYISGPKNSDKQGTAVPVIYGGPVVAGSKVASLHIDPKQNPVKTEVFRSIVERFVEMEVDTSLVPTSAKYLNADMSTGSPNLVMASIRCLNYASNTSTLVEVKVAVKSERVIPVTELYGSGELWAALQLNGQTINFIQQRVLAWKNGVITYSRTIDLNTSYDSLEEGGYVRLVMFAPYGKSAGAEWLFIPGVTMSVTPVYESNSWGGQDG